MNASLRTCLVLFFIACIVTTLTAQPGTLSSSFGANGLLTDPSRQAFEKTIVSQPDKKILIGSQGFYQGYQTFLVDRLMPDGNKDTTFGTNGTAFILFKDPHNTGNVSSEVDAIALLPDGKIMAAGHATGGGKNIAITRLLANGTPDTLFGKNGTGLTGFNFDETINALAIQPDGRMLMAGFTQVSPSPADYRFFTARWLPDGTIDSSFGNKGIVVSASTGVANAVVVQPDNKILSAGYSNGMDGIHFHMERYNADGSYDNGFGAGGIADNNMDGAFLNFLNDVALQADGKIVAAARTNLQLFTIVRYNSNGTFDNSFGNGGVVTTPLPNASGEARKIMLTAKGGHILAAGSRSDNSGSDFVVVSYNIAGTPDSAFGEAGIVTTDFGGTDFDNSATLCKDGSLVALGSNAGQYPFAVRALAKYNGYPVMVPLFVKIKRWLHNHTITWNGLPASENIASYQVEQSSDGKTGFTKIAEMSGATNAKEYSVTNSHMLPGMNYYRIEAMGADGSVKYSEIVQADNIVSTLSVYPNPAKDVIVIGGLRTDGTSIISIAGNNGKVMMKVVSNSVVQHRVAVNNLIKGTYYVTVTNPDKSAQTVMFVKE